MVRRVLPHTVAGEAQAPPATRILRGRPDRLHRQKSLWKSTIFGQLSLVAIARGGQSRASSDPPGTDDVH